MPSARQYPVRAPEWRLAYAGENITAKIIGAVTEITYTDLYAGVGNIEVKLEDKDKLWQGSRFPTQGDLLELVIGYAGEKKLDCGQGHPFQVDELELTGPPDVFTIRALPAWVTKPLRTPTSFAYENQTLLQVAGVVAAKHGMTVKGVPNDINVSFERVTQNRETDLGFLRRLANENDYDFSIHGTLISFHSRTFQHAKAPVLNIDRTQVEKFSFKSRAFQIYDSATVSYQSSETGELITGSATTTVVPSTLVDKLNIVRRAENASDATQKANAALRMQNMIFATAELTMPGNILIVAANNITISGFGKYSAKYYIMQARHKLSRETGYTTEIELQQVPN